MGSQSPQMVVYPLVKLADHTLVKEVSQRKSTWKTDFSNSYFIKAWLESYGESGYFSSVQNKSMLLKNKKGKIKQGCMKPTLSFIHSLDSRIWEYF